MYLCQASIEHFGCTDFGIFAQSVYSPKAAPQYAQYIFAARKFLPKATNSPHTPKIARTLRFPKTSLLCNNFQDVFYNIAGYPSACLAGLFYKCRAKIARPQLHTRACSLPQLVKFKIKPVSAISHVSALSQSADGAACVRKPSLGFTHARVMSARKDSVR